MIDDDFIPGVDQENSAQEAPSGALPHDTEKPAQDQVLDALPKEDVTEILRATHRFGVRDDDPLWVAILTLLHVDTLVKTAQETASQVEQATAKVGPSIYDNAVKVSNDLKGVINNDIRKNAADVGRATANAIMITINKGAEKIQEVAADLDRIAKEKGDTFAASWRAQAARAGEEQAKAAVQKAIAVRWGVVITTIALSIVVGVMLATGFIDLSGHLLPWRWALVTNPQGISECGLTSAYPRNPMCWVRSY